MSYCRKSTVRKLFAKEFRASADFFETLDKKVAWKVKKAMERAKANKRKTLRGYDL